MNHSALDVNKTAGSGFVLALFVPAVLSLLLISSQASGQLSGNYTIGSGGTYPNFAAAVGALNAQGIAGPVVFKVLTGTYHEHIVLPAITGSSASHTVTFESNTGNAADVSLYYAASTPESNYVVRVSGAMYLRFHAMSFQSNTTDGAGYSTVFDLAAGWDYFTVDSSNLAGATNANGGPAALIVTSTAANANSCIIRENTFSNGAYGIDISGAGSSTLTRGTQIINNTFNGPRYGIYLLYNDSPLISGNTFSNPVYTGIAVDYSANDIQIVKNTIISSIATYAITASYSTGGAGTLGNPPKALVANNFIAFSGSSTGIYLYASTNFNVDYNSVNLTVAAGSNDLYIYAGSGNSIAIENNIFANSGGGFALNVATPSAVGLSNYNDLYATGNYVASWNGTSLRDLASLQTASSYEANSVTYNPMFVSPTNLHARSPWINGRATPIAGITDDIDGQARDGSTPDIGADEFTPAAGTTTPLAGAYTIGSGGAYPTFTTAVGDLLLKGVSAPVTFNVLTGTYNEHLVLTDVPGTSASNTVTFEAASGNAAGATLYYFASAPESNYVVDVLGAHYIRFHKLTLQANNTSGASYATVFTLNGGWDNLTIDSSNIGGATNTSNLNQVLITTGTAATATSCIINGNALSNDGYGISIVGLGSSAPTKGTQISNNTFNGIYGNIFLEYNDAPVVSGNTLNNVGATGIEVDYSSNGIQVVKNKITSSSANYGIYTGYSSGGPGTLGNPPKALVADNFISLSSNGTGIYLYSAANFNIFYNSVNLTGNSGTSDLYTYAGSGNSVSIENNVFANIGGGFTINIYTPAAVGTSNYNDLYTTGNYLASWNNVTLQDLAALQAASSFESNSVTYNPLFVSAANLHARSPWINGRATPLAEVSDDIDGQPRDPSTPDIGADEFTPSAGSTPPLAGPYTIGSGGSYPTFNAAAGDLLLRGVSAPVTFNVLTGTYNEHIVLTDVPGSSASNTVTFEAASGNAASATLYFFATAPESNYVVKIIGAHNLRFHKLTLQANNTASASYATVFSLYGGWDNMTIDSSILGGAANTSGGNQALITTSSAATAKSCTINGNTFSNDAYGIIITGLSASALTKGTQITNNTFNGLWEGMYLQYNDAPGISGNTLTNIGSIGMEVDYSSNAIQILKNKINSSAASYGIYMSNSSGGPGTLGNPPKGLLADNLISLSGTGSGITLISSTNLNIYYNSVNITGSNLYTSALYTYAGSGNSVTIENNVFSNTAGGYTMNIATPGGVGLSDYNDLYATGNYIATWNNVLMQTLAALQSASSFEANSVTYNPVFVSPTNLHAMSPWINGRATPLAEVTDDIDGQARDGSTPDIGADEFTPAPGTTTPLAGAYSIGSGGTYPTFTAAAGDLLLKGVSAPVTFNVLSGSYNEHIVLTDVPGAGPANIVTFEAATGNAASATLFYSASAPESNYVVKIIGAHYLRFHKLTLQANNTVSASFATVFNLNGGWDNLMIDSSNLGGATNTSNGNQVLIATNSAATATSCIIHGNTFSNDGIGVEIIGLSGSALSKGTQVTNNTFTGLYSGVLLQYNDAPLVSGNSINGPAGYTGIEVDYSTNGTRIIKNKLNLPNGGYGISLNYTTGGAGGFNPPNALIANNFVAVASNGGASGIYLYSCGYIDAYYNSVNMSGNTSVSNAFYAYGGSLNTNEVSDNIFANPGGGYAYFCGTVNSIDVSDFNDLHTSGTTLAYWNGPQATLSNLQSASGREAHSLSASPGFYSASNLHTNSPALDSMATPLAAVIDDIDGNLRDPVRPDIGASEFSSSTTFTQQISGGWNLISVPLTVADGRKTTLYPSATSHAFLYGPGGYVLQDTLTNKIGYWLKFAAAKTAPIAGTLRALDTITVRSGWNMIGSISFPVPVAAVIQSPPGIVHSPYFLYAGGIGYYQTDTIRPGAGCWVKTSAAGSLILGVGPEAARPGQAARISAGPDLDRFNELTVSGGTSSSQGAMLYFAHSDQTGEALDEYTFPPTPPADVFDVRFASNRYVESFTVDGVNRDEIPISMQGNEGPVKISWSMHEGGPVKYLLVERTTGTAAPGSPVIRHLLDAPGSMTFDPRTGTTLSLEIAAAPDAFALGQNYPNPFNPATNISYTVGSRGGATPVTIRVYDVLGKEVATLVNEVQQPGAYSTRWDAGGFASGVYYYRISAGSFSDVKTMILMK